MTKYQHSSSATRPSLSSIHYQTNENMAKDIVNEIVGGVVPTSSATKIQSAIRNKNARNKANSKRITNMENQLGQIENKIVLGTEQHVKMLENQLGNIRQNKTMKTIKSVSNFGQLSSGALKQDKQITASINAARKQYNKIGENMMKRNEAILRPANRELIQSKARNKIKKYQDQISHIDTRSNLPQKLKNKTIENANKKIAMLDKIVKKKSTAGRPRTRTGTEEATGSVGPRLSMLSSTSTQGAAFTPKKKK